MKYEPKAGDLLYASCAGEDIYRILGHGEDGNGVSTIDVAVLDLTVFPFGNEDDEEHPWNNPLTYIEVPPGVELIMRALQWRDVSLPDTALVEVNGPPNGCYRCCYLLRPHAPGEP